MARDVNEPKNEYMVIDLKSFFASVECVERGLDPFTTNLVVADPDREKGTLCLAITPAMKALGVKNRCRVYEIPKEIDYIIVYGASLEEEKVKHGDMFATPCGRCRQRLYEHTEDTTKVYAVSEDGTNVKIFEMQELLPERFSSDNL